MAHAEHGDGARREGQSWLAENETGSFWESRRGTAEFLGISERQVNRVIAGLESHGLIECLGEWRLPNGRITKRYEVTEEPVKRALRTVAKRHDPSLFDP